MKRIAFAVFSSFMLSACGSAPSARAVQVAALTGSEPAGAALFASTCKSCHGTNGTGTASGPTLVEPAKNDPATEVIDVIINGKGRGEMASYASLSDQQIADLYAHIKTFAK